ncbi:hypothetical protein EVG20_g6645 [Dentipellis fragilis]|uniref:F-box domain-containing protein n=1 Tax=Dentipellis fragilis TaxID=205917 RepID=A0A4Y9YLN0_9AGAM|nr:hypothetical protein EVG20_g6645 [Dentipellis fragilis]
MCAPTCHLLFHRTSPACKLDSTGRREADGETALPGQWYTVSRARVLCAPPHTRRTHPLCLCVASRAFLLPIVSPVPPPPVVSGVARKSFEYMVLKCESSIGACLQALYMRLPEAGSLMPAQATGGAISSLFGFILSYSPDTSTSAWVTKQLSGSHLDPQSFWDSSIQSRLRLLDHHSASEASKNGRVQEKWDRELGAAEGALATLRYGRNRICPVNTLPPEILVRIFQDFNVSPGNRRRRSYVASLRLGWIVVTHVCRYWRQVALSFNALWRKICFSLGKDWTMEMLRRSGNVPIIYKQHFGSPRFRLQPNVETIVQHMHRIQTLSFQAGSFALDPLFTALMNPAPVLENLELYAFHDSAEFPARQLPEQFFEGQAPRLHRIAMHNIHINWQSPILTRVRYLEIRADGDPGWAYEFAHKLPVLRDMLDGLATAPDLETLILVNAMSNGPASIECPVRLPQLRRLVVWTETAMCHRFVSSLDFPPTTDTELVCYSPEEPGPDAYALISLLSRFNGGLDGSNEPTTTPLVKIACWELDNIFTMQTSHNNEDVPEGLAVHPMPNIRLQILQPLIRDNHRPVGLQLFKAICNALNVRTVRYLALNFPEPPLHSDWRLINTQMPELVFIDTYSMTMAVKFATVLCHPLANPVLDTQTTMPVDNEQGMAFLRLRAWALHHTNFETLFGDFSLGMVLPDMIKVRQQSTKPLKELFLRNCWIEARCVDKLKEIIRVDTDFYHLTDLHHPLGDTRHDDRAEEVEPDGLSYLLHTDDELDDDEMDPPATAYLPPHITA